MASEADSSSEAGDCDCLSCLCLQVRKITMVVKMKNNMTMDVTTPAINVLSNVYVLSSFVEAMRSCCWLRN